MAEKKSDKNQNFEKALKRLEILVSEMESGTLDLETMMACFEEGTELVKFCTQKLNEVEKKIEILTQKGNSVVTEPFEPSESEKSPSEGQSKL
jgi:exodeoxyribonuclease VII small subunit